MPSRNTHITIAVILLIIIYYILNHFSLNNYLGYTITLLVGSILPDIFDPWTKENGYNHRSYWHSKRLLKILAILLLITLVLGFLINIIFYFTFLIIGYISHLGLDSIKTTSWSKGLPD